MRRSIVLVVFFVVAMAAKSQDKPPFPDGKFENCWEWFVNVTPGKSDYWDFKENYFLSTLNQLHELTGDEGDAPLTAFRLDGADVYDGNYSLKLVSNPMVLGGDQLFLPGVAATLYIVFFPEINCILGEPFTARPSNIKGYHKYTPVNGDSAAIEVILKRGGNRIGGGKQVIKGSVPNWAAFDVPITYSIDQIPDSIVVIFAASANYDFTDINTLMKCKGQAGSTLCIDNVEYVYDSINVGVKEMFDPAIKMSVYPNPSKESVSLTIAKETNGTVIIYDYLTRKIGEYSINGTQIDIDIQDYAAGSYLINVIENGKVITTNRFAKE